jgi:NAD(P)-dependent dehydrogenase (short-subunit alcohol dehydrogenase family)
VTSTRGERLQDHVAIVTGAGRGIGRAIALAFARQGAAVVVAARTEEQVRATAQEIAASDGRALPVVCDVTDDDDVASLHQTVTGELGTPDIVVNNAGMHRPAAFADYTLEDWQRFTDVNLLGVVRVLRVFLPAMAERGTGRVINVASTAGKYGSLYQSPYNATKHAVVGLTRCLALEYAGAGLRVNAICPGFVRTDMIETSMREWQHLYDLEGPALEAAFLAKIPIGRFLEPEEIADLAVYLASPEADGMTGQALTLAGGLILV